MTAYFPAPGDAWEKIEPQSAGLDPSRLHEAVAFAIEAESPMNRNIQEALDEGHFSEPPPLGDIIGPTRDRGDPHGLVIKGGRIVAEWGDPSSVDMTFSAAKSYLSICAGLAHDEGLIPDFDAPIADLVDDGGFEPPHNSQITWRHLLQQTSEWEGELWSKPDMVDRNRVLGAKPGADVTKGTFRALQTPGTFWEYNDVRVNRLALALLRVWRRPLPEVIRERVMDPIGCSDTWEWHGYRNSWVEIDGEQMQSVSGGAHWGGGIFINSFDHARVGLLMLNRGRWGDRQILSEDYVNQALTPCPLQKDYGFMWWLNTGNTQAPSAPESSFFARGVGVNWVWCEPENDMVAVVRWIDGDHTDGFCKRLMAAVT